jgi:hypothetical protein
MILADFFPTQEKLDRFIVSMPVNHMAMVQDNTMYLIHCERIRPNGRVSAIKGVKKFSLETDKKKYRHH